MIKTCALPGFTGSAAQRPRFSLSRVAEYHLDQRYLRRSVMTGVVQVIGNGIFGLVAG
jgi:hypothetical protein